MVGTFGPLLHRHLSRMLPGDVDDVLQQTLVKAFRNLDRFRGDAKLSTWLYRIATNEALSHLRSQKRRSRWEVTGEDTAQLAGRVAADVYLDADEIQRALRSAIAELPAKQRAVFTLRYFEELPYREISEITGTSEGALKASYHLAAKKIEQKLKAYAD